MDMEVFETIAPFVDDELASSSDGEPPPPKRRRGCAKEWKKVKEFATPDDVEKVRKHIFTIRT